MGASSSCWGCCCSLVSSADESSTGAIFDAPCTTWPILLAAAGEEKVENASTVVGERCIPQARPRRSRRIAAAARGELIAILLAEEWTDLSTCQPARHAPARSVKRNLVFSSGFWIRRLSKIQTQSQKSSKLLLAEPREDDEAGTRRGVEQRVGVGVVPVAAAPVGFELRMLEIVRPVQCDD